MKINKCNKLVCNLYDKNNYVIHIRALTQALNSTSIKSWINFLKSEWSNSIYQKACLRPYIDMNKKLRKEAKDDFEKDHLR